MPSMLEPWMIWYNYCKRFEASIFDLLERMGRADDGTLRPHREVESDLDLFMLLSGIEAGYRRDKQRAEQERQAAERMQRPR